MPLLNPDEIRIIRECLFSFSSVYFLLMLTATFTGCVQWINSCIVVLVRFINIYSESVIVSSHWTLNFNYTSNESSPVSIKTHGELSYLQLLSSISHDLEIV
jgi:hypothetical protein